MKSFMGWITPSTRFCCPNCENPNGSDIFEPTLTICPEQMDALLEQRRIQLLVSHVRKFFPEQSAAVKPPALDDAARSAIKRARGYGLNSIRDAMQFFDLMFARIVYNTPLACHLAATNFASLFRDA